MDIMLFLAIIAVILGVLCVYLGILVLKYQKPVYTKENVKVIDVTAHPDPNLRITYKNIPVTTSLS
jgi:hypothetical protein